MGRIFTGITNAGGIIGCTSSIPTKYQTVVICNEEKKGFCSQSKRFPLNSLNESPGPGAYCCFSSAETFSPSFSKKGTTSFPSKVPRAGGRRLPNRGMPGPGSYNLQSTLVTHHCFGLGLSRAFRAPVAVPVQGPNFQTPGPNQYDVCGGNSGRNFLTKGSPAFLSRTQRCSLAVHPDLPSPCHYQVRSAGTQDHPKFATSPFRSKSSRFPAQVDQRVPGPGAYDPHQTTPDPVRRPTLPRRHVLVMAMPALVLPKGPASPGPGQYDIVDYRGPPRHPVSTSAFLSDGRRGPHGGRTGPDRPGPDYELQRISKKSFLYNAWVWSPAPKP